MWMVSLCSGSKGNCSLIGQGDTLLMVDCGASQKYIKTRLSELNIDLKQIDAVLVTHDHVDHVRSLKMCSSLPCYGCCAKVPLKRLKPLTPFEIKDLIITPLPLSHDAPDTCGYLIQSNREKLVYLTDTGYVPKRLFPLIHNAEYYFIESNHDVVMLMNSARPQHVKARIYSDRGHLCNEDCAEVLRKVIGPSTREIMLAHLSEEANDPQLALRVIKEKLKDHPLCSQFRLQAAKQFECCWGGESDEKTDARPADRTDRLECIFDL